MEIKKTAIENFVQCLTCNIQVGEAVRGSVATRRKAVQWISLIWAAMSVSVWPVANANAHVADRLNMYVCEKLQL